MKSLLEHDAANTPSLLGCALEHDRTEQKTSECGCEGRFFARRSGRDRDSGLPLGWHRQEAGMCVVLARVSPEPFHPMFGHCFGAYATPGGRLALLLCCAPSGLRFPSAIDPP
jgi:hypothetical protein